MAAYIARRLLLMIPTLFGIMLLNFVIVQLAPGGPVERVLQGLEGRGADATARIAGSDTGDTLRAGTPAPGAAGESSAYRGARGLPPEFIKQLEKQFGFDKPLHERFLLMMRNYLVLDFGSSYFRSETVVNLVLEKMPVSISLGLWSTLVIYLISIPLGVAKAVRDGSRFDVWTSGAIIAGYAIPAFLFAVLLIVLFAGGRYLDWFPLRGLVSDNWSDLSWPARVIDYLWHMVLPVAALTIGGFAGLTMLTKNSFLDEIGKHYVMTARMKGL
ncbi:MAG: ABC transporter permease subunit, partial [Alphaproteobacteria bacterium]|nr:ABC transporter permease subunit [Alphaproteobacteria bacterium]